MSKITIIKLSEDVNAYEAALLSVFVPGNEDDIYPMENIRDIMGTESEKTYIRIKAEKLILERAFDPKMKSNQFINLMNVSFLIRDPENEMKTKDANKCFVMGIDYWLLQNWHINILNETKEKPVPSHIKYMFSLIIKRINHPELIINGYSNE